MIDRSSGDAPIGILGGTFDPVHVGHIRLAIEALETLRLSAVRIIPLNQPNHREAPVAAAERRFEMLRSSVDGKRLVADDRELRRGGVSYTIDTLESIGAEFSQAPLYLLLGADAFQGLCDWHRWQELLEYCHLVVVARPDTGAALDSRLRRLVDTVATADLDILRRERCGRIYFQPIPLLPISSTDIRARIAGGRDISYLAPPSVQRLIEEHQLYKSSE
jgi:nicotinate-nucleotide adenylyltransferase